MHSTGDDIQNCRCFREVPGFCVYNSFTFLQAMMFRRINEVFQSLFILAVMMVECFFVVFLKPYYAGVIEEISNAPVIPVAQASFYIPPAAPIV